MRDEELLELYKPMVKFLADMNGPSCEVVLHNIKTPSHSVIAIQNGYLSGRSIGSPLTEFAKKEAESGIYKSIDYMSNYNGSTKGREFVSSTYFIKNTKGELIGMLCCNRDLSVIDELQSTLSRMRAQYSLINNSSSVKETLDIPANQELSDMISNEIKQSGKDPSEMKSSERAAVVISMQKNGILKIKGAVKEIARQLDISIPTVYRYLNTIYNN